MNKLTSWIRKTFEPSKAIILYSQANQGGLFGTNNDYYLEWHEIEKGKLLTGKPVDEDFMHQLSLIVNQDIHDDKLFINGLILDHILHFSGNFKKYKLCWWRPSEKRVIHFDAKLEIPSGEVTVPPLLFFVSNRQLQVFAYLGDKESKTIGRPSGNEHLYNAPFHNIGKSGSVCLGNAKVTKPKKPEVNILIEYYEQLFWGSEFTAQHNNDLAKENINTIWKKMVTEKTDHFPLEILKVTNMKVNSLFK